MSGAASLWPWLAVAGAGAVHGLNPCTGWALAAACGWRDRDGRAAVKALVPLALGHAASVAIVAVAVAVGMSMDALPLLAGAGAAALALLLWQRRHRGARLALWSFIVATLHGSGLMLLPALVPLCLSASPAKALTASGSLVLALAAVGVHMVAMLATTALAALLVCRLARHRTAGQRAPECAHAPFHARPRGLLATWLRRTRLRAGALSSAGPSPLLRAVPGGHGAAHFRR